ncbi:MAG: YqzL family protein [Clostridia bacterium]|nr:YqzL family protein [Clostridia bacterium]
MDLFSWETFTRTGSIEAYLLYKEVITNDSKEDNGEVCQITEQEELL